jgi:hypothetical protein
MLSVNKTNTPMLITTPLAPTAKKRTNRLTIGEVMKSANAPTGGFCLMSVSLSHFARNGNHELWACPRSADSVTGNMSSNRPDCGRREAKTHSVRDSL